MLSELLIQHATMIDKYLCNINTGFSTRLVTYLLHLLTSIPLPVYIFVRFTSILLFSASDYNSLCLVGFGHSLTVLWSH